MEKAPLISVVMSVYNDEKYIRESLDSLFAQTLQDFEIIIIDDCSKDRTAEIVRSYGEEKIRLILNEENKGLTKNLNTGLKLARGSYIARMDGDDICRPKRFEKQIAYLEAHPEVSLISCRTHMFGEEDLISAIQGTPEELKAMMLIRPVLAHPGFMMRAELVKEEGFFYDESFKSAQDYNFAVRVSERFGIGITPEVLLDYRVHKKQVSSTHTGEQMSNADRTRQYQLDRLGVCLAKRQQQVYKTWAMEEKAGSAEEILEAADVITLLEEANRKKHLYEEKVLDQKLKELLYQWVLRSKSPALFLKAGKICGRKVRNLALFVKTAAKTAGRRIQNRRV